MVDIDEILAAAIRTAWLEISGPESRSPHHIEVETARRVRSALEREGIIITPSRPMPETAARAVARPQRASHRVALTFRSYPLPAFTKDVMVRFLCHVPN